MECSRIMLIVFVVTITEFNTTTVITARRPTLVLKSKNEWKTKPPGTVNANSEERGKWRTRGVTTTTIFQRHLEKEKIPTTDISIKSTKTLATNNSTTFSHDPDNSEHIVTIVGITVPLLVVVTVVGLLFLCYYKRLLCFKIKTKRDSDNSSSPEDIDLIVDIKEEHERYPVRTKDKQMIKLLHNIQPSDASE